ncbi:MULTISPECIES: AIPR family protein [Shewanella]|uniref:AIPR family protein n=1 Tax=Shewanella TaxID=22 RepID=UPI0014310791|nr:AIPR family protein [Shewanella sp. Iso12]NJI86473.1 AIPR family protein [Shewanella sp. Iso12]
MELVDFLRQTQAEVKELLNDRMEMPGEPYPYPESVFTEVMMQHMADVGMTFEPEVCHFDARVGNAKVRLSGYAYTDDMDQLDMFASLYADATDIQRVAVSDVTKVAEHCLRFLSLCAEKKLVSKMDQASEAHALAQIIQEKYRDFNQIRIYVLTDQVLNAKSKQFQSREIQGKTIKLEVMDIERLFRHTSAGRPRDELVVNFEEVSGGPLPCVWVPGQVSEYDYAMTVIPGEALRFVYDKYGPRVLEANVRSFLSAVGKVNKGIRDTLRTDPERFMAYNNGLVIVADEMHIGKSGDGTPGITWLKGMQIVNGGQTTASLYFTKKKHPEIDLSKVRVPAKLIVLRKQDSSDEDKLISDISRYANSQNAVKQSDLSANHPLHVLLDNFSQSTYCPDGEGRWFYERAAGSYKVLLEREGTTPAKLKRLKASIPPARKITKPDMAKYLYIWAQKPEVVSLGAQKNFLAFMDNLSDFEWESGEEQPTLDDYRKLIAKAILFKVATKLIRPQFQAFQGNITIYTLSLLALKLGSCIDLEVIWKNQDISKQLKDQILIWASEVQKQLHSSSSGRMISEWAKKNECWQQLRAKSFSKPLKSIPECKG